MESNYHEGKSINSSEDHEINQENCDSGVGRSYECVFCKRGFNTAQALGGHMNIHRKDRARKKPMTSNDSNKRDVDDIYTDPRLCQQIPASSYCNTIQSAGGHRFESRNDRQANLSYATYFPESSSITRSSYGAEESDRNHPQPLDLVIHGDRSMSVDLELSQRIMEDLDKKGQVMNQKEELDLELRLGYD